MIDFYDFVDKYDDKPPFDVFYHRVVDLVNLIDTKKAVKYLDKYYQKGKIDLSTDGDYFEYKLFIVLGDKHLYESVLLNNEKLKVMLLQKYENLFDFKVINENFDSYYPIDNDEILYDELDKIEEQLSHLVKGFLRTKENKKNAEKYVARVLSINTDCIFSMLFEYETKSVDRIIFLALAFQRFVTYKVKTKNSKVFVLYFNVIKWSLCYFVDFINQNKMSTDDYDNKTILYPSFIIKELGRSIDINDIFDITFW